MLSRVADSLYWMARYAERAEHGARLLRVRLEAMIEQGELESSEGWRRTLYALADTDPEDPSADPRDITYRVAFERTNPSSLISAIAAARDNARQVREQTSSEMWEQINRQYLKVTTLDYDWIWAGNPAQTFIDIGDGIWMFQGITQSTMRHGEASMPCMGSERMNTVVRIPSMAPRLVSDSTMATWFWKQVTWIGSLKISCMRPASS